MFGIAYRSNTSHDYGHLYGHPLRDSNRSLLMLNVFLLYVPIAFFIYSESTDYFQQVRCGVTASIARFQSRSEQIGVRFPASEFLFLTFFLPRTLFLYSSRRCFFIFIFSFFFYPRGMVSLENVDIVTLMLDSKIYQITPSMLKLYTRL